MLRTLFNSCGRRNFSKSRLQRDLAKVPPKQDVKPYESSSTYTEKNNLMDFKPSEFEKFILVWSGRFKSKESIPERISFSTMENAKSKFRIRGSNILMLATVALFGCFIYMGKQRLKAGDTILKRELERDAEILSEAKKNKQQ